MCLMLGSMLCVCAVETDGLESSLEPQWGMCGSESNRHGIPKLKKKTQNIRSLLLHNDSKRFLRKVAENIRMNWRFLWNCITVLVHLLLIVLKNQQILSQYFLRHDLLDLGMSLWRSLLGFTCMWWKSRIFLSRDSACVQCGRIAFGYG